MHLVTGATAKRYNVRKERTGSMWEHPFHCTAVENGRHLLNCLVYINMNMVRAGAVTHPREWKWCSHDELLGQRQRYRILNRDRLLECLGAGNTESLAEWYEENLARRMQAGQMVREAHWSESLAVGSQPFVMRASQVHANRRSFSFSDVSSNSGTMWSVREVQCPYSATDYDATHIKAQTRRGRKRLSDLSRRGSQVRCNGHACARRS